MSTEQVPASNAQQQPASGAPAAPSKPEIPAGHKIVPQTEWEQAMAAAEQLKAWKPALDAFGREKIQPDDVVQAFAPQAPKPTKPDGKISPDFIADTAKAAARAAMAEERHAEQMAAEPESINSLVSGTLPASATDTLKTFLTMAARQRAQELREVYPGTHPLAGQPMPLSAAKRGELKTWLDTEGKKLIGSMAIQAAKPGANPVAGYQAPSGAPQNGAAKHIAQWSDQERAANAKDVLARIRATAG